MAHGTFALSVRCTGLSFRRVARAPRLFVSTCMSCGNEQSVPCAFLELIQRHEGFRGFLGQNAKGIFESTKMRR